MDTALITGASRGIGLEFVRQYAAAGWRVFACCRAPERSAALAQLAAGFPGSVRILAVDVADHAQIEHAADLLSGEAIDLLINNAGIGTRSDAKGFGYTDHTEWVHAFRVNTMAPLKMVEAFWQHLEHGRRKTIVTLTSQLGSIQDNRDGGIYLYRSSKAAANMVVKSLALDLRHSGAISVALHPGWVRTDMGGPNGLVSAEQSVAGMRQVIDDLAPADSGEFFTYDGRRLPW